ncbi:MAG: CHASE2 domain-containing protein [Spirulinaceae cyanobacterium]
MLASFAAIAIGFELPLTQNLEQEMQVNFFQWRGQVSPPKDVVIVAIDQDSLKQGELASRAPTEYPELQTIQQFPWQRKAYADAIAKILDAGAKSVSVDILFPASSSYGEADDLAFQKILNRYGDRIILAVAHETSRTAQGYQHQLVKPNSSLQAEPQQLGLINFQPAPDKQILNLSLNYSQKLLKPLNLPMLPSFTEATLNAAQVDYNIPTGDSIYYYGKPGTFTHISFWHILDPQAWKMYEDQDFFKDKIVLIGATADSLQDFKHSPFSLAMAGVEVHANAIATLLENRAIAQAFPNPIGSGIFVFILVAGMGATLQRFLEKPTRQFLSAIAISVTWIGISYASFTYAYLILPVALPAGAIALCGISNLTLGAIREQLERRRLHNTLERYVAAPIVREILNRRNDDFQTLLKGRKVKAAILFSDIRSFTTFSLTHDAEAVVTQLNTYLEAMVEAILTEGGTLDKFIGDAVMAEFGSPISHGEKEDALKAVRAALKMRQALVHLQKIWRVQGQEILFNGIGIHFGEVIVGDIGSSQRREFAVIGDAVNVASRIEGLTGKLYVDILISDSLYQLVREEVNVVEMGEHALKGRGDNKIKLYSLIGLKNEDNTTYLQVRNSLRQYLNFKDRDVPDSGLVNPMTRKCE